MSFRQVASPSVPLFAITEGVLVAMVAAGGVLGGAILSAISGWLAVRGKLRELEVTHQQRLSDSHLAAARAHQDSIYVPLSADLGVLSDAYLVLREQVEGKVAEGGVREMFAGSVDRYLEAVRAVTAEGRDAFLTAELDAVLRDFGAFVKASKTATGPRARMVVSSGLLARVRSGPIEVSGAAVSAGRLMSTVRLSAGLMAIEVDEVLAAPFGSREFDRRFQRDVAALRSAIRDVTLGAAV